VTRLRRDARVLRVGHRGAAALEPENTLASLRRAVELGVDFVEFDVLDLADGTLVLAHSDDLLEVSHGAAGGSVRALRLAELREVAPDLPTFEQALDLFAENGAGLHVDVKCLRHGREVSAALRRHGLVDRAVASSHWTPTLRDLRTEEPELAVGLTYPDDRRGLARRRLLAPLVPTVVGVLARALPRRLPRWLRSTGASVAMLHYAVLSPAAVERCHQAGAAVWTWTVNERTLLERVVALGVDGVTSDDPRLFLQFST
jgi:glycerophosphoryl diester phosphodiesterase